jgi:hypothetical protein
MYFFVHSCIAPVLPSMADPLTSPCLVVAALGRVSIKIPSLSLYIHESPRPQSSLLQLTRSPARVWWWLHWGESLSRSRPYLCTFMNCPGPSPPYYDWPAHQPMSGGGCIGASLYQDPVPIFVHSWIAPAPVLPSTAYPLPSPARVWRWLHCGESLSRALPIFVHSCIALAPVLPTTAEPLTSPYVSLPCSDILFTGPSSFSPWFVAVWCVRHYFAPGWLRQNPTLLFASVKYVSGVTFYAWLRLG